MAKLSARGRTELLRMEKKGDGHTTTFALMSDGVVLCKSDFKSRNSFTGKEETISSGWKVFGSFPGGIDEFRTMCERRGCTAA